MKIILILLTILSFNAWSQEKLDHLVLNTNKGPIIIELDQVGTPVHFNAITKMVEMGVYNGINLAYGQDSYYVQMGGEEFRNYGFYPEQREIIKPLPNELTEFKHYRGAVTMPSSPGDKLQGGEYLFTFMLDQAQELDQKQTVIGFVISGLEILDQIAATGDKEALLKNPLTIQSSLFMTKEQAKAYSEKLVNSDFNSDILEFSLFAFLAIVLIQLFSHFAKEKVDKQIIQSLQLVVLLIATFSFLAQTYPLVENSTTYSVVFVAAMVLCFKVMASLEHSRGLTR